MKTMTFIKAAFVIALVIGFLCFVFAPKSEMQTQNRVKIVGKNFVDVNEAADYKSWTKVNDKPQYMPSRVAMMCITPTEKEIDDEAKNPHIEKYLTVYVNSIGKDEMLTKKNPHFPVGTIIVKEKLSSPDSKTPELLTVMVKREKGFNAEVGDWEFMTLNGAASEITAKGKLESCQSCHIGYKERDFIARTYLTDIIKQKLK